MVTLHSMSTVDILDVVIRIILAAVLGGLIGIEREIREHTAGFRTHILVSVGAAAFTVASATALGGTQFDPNRIAAQVVSGIGFLGAGAIIRHGVSVRGLTTAASLWAVAAVGLAVGKGLYLLAVMTTAMVVISLYALRLIEKRVIYRLVGAPINARIRVTGHSYRALTKLLDGLEKGRVEVKEMTTEPVEDDAETIRLLLRLPRRMTKVELASLILEIDNTEIIDLN
jgi:putative Mg2+ transporter-C (MgtC) family protein